MIKSSPSTRVVLLLAGALVALAAAGHLSAGSGSQDPLPFDPLSDDERDRAISIALDDGNLTQQVSDRLVVIGAALYTDKAHASMDTWPRMAEVWVYDHETNLTLRALVDLDQGTVASLEDLDVQPPLTRPEIDQAGQMALDDERVREHLREVGADPDSVAWTARLWTGPGPTQCPDHRCALVGFFDGDVYLHDVTALVDLTEVEVDGVLEGHGSHDHGEVDR